MRDHIHEKNHFLSESPFRRAFTLTEMLIAIAILLIVILATSSIFSTSQRVASLGEANAGLLQQANAIERVIREDFDRLSRDGIFAVQCVGVPNDINFSETGRLLDPNRKPNDEVRADQVFFFTEGLAGSTRAVEGYANASDETLGVNVPAPQQSYFSSVFYSPGIQVPIQPYEGDPTAGSAFDVDRQALESSSGTGLYPWSYLPALDLSFTRWPTNSTVVSSAPLIPLQTPDWLLCRQAILLGDDDGSRAVTAGNTGEYYMGLDVRGPNSAPSLFYNNGAGLRFQPDLVNSRVDIAATERDTLRQEICFYWNEDDWDGLPGGDEDFIKSPSDLVRTEQVLNAMFYGYPRGERIAPSMKRMDTMLTNAVLGAHVSDFRVEWTWADGVGRDLDVSFPSSQNAGIFRGGLPGVAVGGGVLTRQDSSSDDPDVVQDRGVSTPWFGLSDLETGAAPASAFMDGSLDPENSAGCDSPSAWAHFDPDVTNEVRIGLPVGHEMFSASPISLEAPTGIQPDQTLQHIEYGENVNCDPFPRDSLGRPIRRYGAVFGFNSENPILRRANGEPYVEFDVQNTNSGNPILGSRVIASDEDAEPRAVSTYTPWPTAVRISFRLHDSEGRLEGGREFQFIIPLRRTES